MDNILNLINSKYWVIVTSTDNEIVFATERHEYTIYKRPIFGFRFTVSSLIHIERHDIIFKDEEELISFIKKIRLHGKKKLFLRSYNLFLNTVK